VTARYFPGSGILDGYYLDGRLNSRREHRAVDSTLDREDRGFFYAAYASPAAHGAEESLAPRAHKALDRILNDVKQNVRNIDAEINELAECAVEIAGRGTLQHENARQPYFAGIMVKDAELAAITMGFGCVYLYRNDALYPLTHDDIRLEPVDYHGKPVPGQDIYCAGVAGTVRYSNIAQLQPDDCVLICNKEIMSALGQREMLRLLYEAEDQADAAGLIITAAAAKLPGTPLQVIACFVENIQTVEKAAGHPVPGRPGFTGGRSSQRQGKAAATPDQERPAAIQTRPEIAAAGGSMTPDAVFLPPEPEDEEENPYDRGYFERPRDEGGRVRRIALYMVITAVTIGVVFAIFNMIFGKNSDSAPLAVTSAAETSVAETTNETTASVTEETSETRPEETTEEQTTQETTATTAAPAAEVTVHTVKSGDTLYSIALKYLHDGSQESIDKIKAYNGIKSDNLQLGQKIKIPPQ
jgi:LysM repeat protein